MLFSWLDPCWMIKTVRFARFIVQTFPLFGFPMFAPGFFTLSWFIDITYFRVLQFWWTRLHLCHPYSDRITIRWRSQFHCTRFEACWTARKRGFWLSWFFNSLAFFCVVFATWTGTIDSGSSLFFRWTVVLVVIRRTMCITTVVHVVIVVKVAVKICR